MTIDDITTVDGQMLIALRDRPHLSRHPSTRLSVSTGRSAEPDHGHQPEQPLALPRPTGRTTHAPDHHPAAIPRLEIPNLNGRTRAFREMLLQAPPSVVAGMLGYGTNRAEALAAEAGPPGSTTPLVTTRVIESRTPAPDVAWGAGWPNFSVLGRLHPCAAPSGQRY